MDEVITVKPTAKFIQNNWVSLSEIDDAHYEADERWKNDGGLFIAGDKLNPDKTYKVANTPGVQDAIRAGKLEKVTAKAEPDKSGDLDALTIAQLKGLAEERGVDLGDATKKADIIAKLNEAGITAA